jgi:hypothetical protein
VALRWRRTFGLHVAAVLWGAGSVVMGWPCPLTGLERWGRAHAGMSELPPEGFIEHYVTGLLYPEEAVGAVQVAVFLAVALSWGLVAARTRERIACE